MKKFYLAVISILIWGCHHKPTTTGLWIEDPREREKGTDVEPLPQSVNDLKVRQPLGSLAEGMTHYLSFDDNLYSSTPNGNEIEARFSRDSVAYTSDFKCIESMQPRYVPGKFNAGLMLEYGKCVCSPTAGMNQLPGPIASASIIKDHFLPVKQAELKLIPGIEGSKALEVIVPKAGGGVKTAVLNIPEASQLTLSMYVKGKKGQELKFGINNKIEERVKLTGDWQRVSKSFGKMDATIEYYWKTAE